MMDGWKETEIGLLPENWIVKSLKEVNSYKNKNINPSQFPNEIFEYYSIPAFQNGEKPEFTQGKEIHSNKLLLESDSIVFGKLNPRVEKVWRIGNHSEHRKIGTTEWITVTPNEFLNPDFLYFVEWSKFVMPIAKSLVSGSTPSRQRVDPTSFYKLKIPVPPLPEQRKIAHVLSTVQKAIKQQDKLIRTTTELKKALMQKLFTEGTRGEPQKETEIGLVPESWEVMRIGDVFKFSSGKSRPKNISKVKTEELIIPVYGGNGILGYSDKIFLNKTTLILGRVGEYCGCTHLTQGMSWITDNALYVKEQKRDINLVFIKNCFEYLDLNQYLERFTPSCTFSF
jgi:type I restriction enzyme S subunit